MMVENLKFNISDIYDLLQYIQQRYPSLLVEVTPDFAEFSNGDKIYFTGDQVLETLDSNVTIDPDTNQLVNSNNPDEKFKYGRFEFLFDFILAKVHDVNPDDNLTKNSFRNNLDINRNFFLPQKLKNLIFHIEIYWMLPPPGSVHCGNFAGPGAYNSSLSKGNSFLRLKDHKKWKMKYEMV